MNSIQVTAIFCEDVREEKNETQTLVGIMSDNVGVPDFPAFLPKVGFYVRIHAPIDAPLTSVEVRITETNGTVAQLSSFDTPMIEEARGNAKANGADFVGLVTRGVAAPFQVLQPGFVSITATVDGVEYLAGQLRFFKGERPAGG